MSSTMKSDDTRSPDEIERDLQQTRAELSGTLEAIQSKLTPGQMMDQALGYLRTSLPADFGHNLADSVRNNPIPVALIGIGIAWMAMSGRRGSMPSAQYANEQYAYEPLGATSLEDPYGSTTSSTPSTISGPSMTERARESMGSARAKVGDTVSSARERVSGTMASARERVSGTMASARESMHHLSERSAHTYGRARDSMGQMIEEQPLILGAIGVAVGAALGAALPRTRQEDQWMGETRDDLMNRATETAKSYADQAAERARSTMQTASERAHRAIDERTERAAASGGQDRPMASSSGTGSRSTAMDDDDRPTVYSGSER